MAIEKQVLNAKDQYLPKPSEDLSTLYRRNQVKVLFYPVLLFSERASRFGRFPGFVSLSFW
jgi:hypothetical protein